MLDRSGLQIDKYRLLRPLGEGGYAEVYLGEHVFMKSYAAVKLISIGRGQPEAVTQSFLAEVQTIARLRHPHIVRILDCGIDQQSGTLYIVMEYAEQGSLRVKHKPGEKVMLSQVVAYVKQVAAALAYAHAQGYMHRDVKPENVLIGPDGTLWLSDFGLVAQAHNTTSFKTLDAGGTTAYSAPEQLQKHPRPASDQYALGLMAYEWLCGERPFTGDLVQLMYQHAFVPAPPLREKLPTITPSVEQAIMRTLAKDPKDRFPSVKAFADALEEAYQQSVKRVLDAFPDVWRAPGGSGAESKGRTREEKAREEIRKNPGKTALQWFNDGYKYYDEKQFQQSADAYTCAIELDPNYGDAYHNRGLAYRNFSQWDLAIEDYNRAMALDPNRSDAYVGRGNAYDDLKQYERAIADYDRAIALDPKYVLAYNNRGRTHERMGNYRLAMQDYEQAIKLDPSYNSARENRDNLRKKMK
jgi:serine/threonine protein kinase